MEKDSCTEWSEFAFLDTEIDCEVIHSLTPVVSFINNLSIRTVQTSKMMEPVSIVLLWSTIHHV